MVELAVSDGRSYFLQHIDSVFLLLEEGMRIKDFWLMLYKRGKAESLEVYLAEMIDAVQDRY